MADVIAQERSRGARKRSASARNYEQAVRQLQQLSTAAAS